MKAFVLEAYGDAENTKLCDFAEPLLKPNDVRIQVKAVGLNPVDFKTREGKLKMIYNQQFPIILGNVLGG